MFIASICAYFFTCLWLDHPFVCIVRIFTIGKFFKALELDRAGLRTVCLGTECRDLAFIML